MECDAYAAAMRFAPGGGVDTQPKELPVPIWRDVEVSVIVGIVNGA